jgi:single-strand DNA-binding protein
MIKMQLIGYLGKDSVVSNVNGKNVINMNVCHTEKYKDSQGVEHNKSLWINCSIWRDSTKVAEFLKKGTQVFVEGEPDVTIYKDAQNQPTAQLKLRVTDLQLLGGKNENDK